MTDEQRKATAPPEKASPDYRRPDENVADMPRPRILSRNKARQGVRVQGMRLVLTIGIGLAVLGLALVYLYFLPAAPDG